MKYRKFRGALALLLALSLFVCFGAGTAFAAYVEEPQVGVLDAMIPIGQIVVLNETFDLNGGTLGGAAEFARQVAKGVKYFMPVAPEKEGDPFVGWQNAEGEMFQPFDRVPIYEDTTFKAIYESDLVTVDPNEAGMKLELRG